MSQYSITLAAGQRTRHETAGRFFMIVAVTGSVGYVELKFDVRGQGDRNDEQIQTAAPGFKLKLENSRFDSVDFLAAGNCVVSYVLSDNEVDFDFSEGANVIATVVGPMPSVIIDDTVPVRVEIDTPLPLPVAIASPLPLPVVNDRGAPGNPVYVSGITYSDAPATSITNSAAVPVTAANTALLAASATRKAARFANIGADPVAIGGAGLTWAQRCIVLEPGDVHFENDGANLAWSAICDTGQTASITCMEVKA
jgi:hypothetical protein